MQTVLLRVALSSSESKPMNNFSRRHFLGLVGAAGGSSAVYQTSLAMGLMADTGLPAKIELKKAPRGARKVAILGAGISGLAVAYELQRAGYDVSVIEASHRVGGRNMTLRHGDLIDEMGQPQICNFDDDPELYFNAGPARIPGHHRRVMHYCKELGVPLQVKANINRIGYIHEEGHFDDKPMRYEEYVSDARGFMSELLYKAVDKNAFEQPLSEEDQVRMRDFARNFGDLDAQGDYKGTNRAGYASGGFLKKGELKTPINFSALLDSSFWRRGLNQSQNHDWAEPLMEAKGGMDNIVKAFVRELKNPVILKAPVQAIRLRDDGVDVYYNQDGKRKKMAADYCFNCIPVHFMEGIPNNLSAEYRTALNAYERGNFFKIGFQMRERFWEDEGIYGGITNTSQKINQIWYPSYGINSKKGVLLGAYAFFKQSEYFERMTPEERLKFAADAGNKIHKGYSDYIEAGVSIPWGRMNHMMGCGARMSEEGYETHFKLLQKPEGRHYMIGDQLSHHSSWQEGAFASSENALMEFNKRTRAEASISRVG